MVVETRKTGSQSVWHCMMCRAKHCELVHEAIPDYFVPTGVVTTYVRCAACGLVQQSPIPTDVRHYYEAYPVHTKKSVTHDFVRRTVLRNVYCPADCLRKGAVVLDYGCGDGWWLDECKKYPVTRIGYEYSEERAKSLQAKLGVPVYWENDALEREWQGRVDQIAIHFVVEHLTDLGGTIQRLARLLRTGGRMYAVYPNLKSLEYRLFGKRWHGFDAPRHISFPSPQQLGLLGSELGLCVERTSYAMFPNTFAGSLSIMLTGRFRYPVFLACLPISMLWSWLVPSGTYRVELVRRSFEDNR